MPSPCSVSCTDLAGLGGRFALGPAAARVSEGYCRLCIRLSPRDCGCATFPGFCFPLPRLLGAALSSSLPFVFGVTFPGLGAAVSWRSEITLKQTLTPANPPIFPARCLKLPSYPLSSSYMVSIIMVSEPNNFISRNHWHKSSSSVRQVRQGNGHGEGRRKHVCRQGRSTAGSSIAGSPQGPGFAAGRADS